ncbi:condensin complex protein MksE [Thalassotalea profundi]|uniref:Uncharacterized protein n=1 Tax=Thalassotalea profundi TaxID=2036687 RepID=A0ABQ3IFC1_9GAMM|nr:hypothetical protein [Thalassotalea profundi]GHE80169.1 hypothetical protein GCM10011501_05000 [Thalassotalea profundi]
MNYASRITQHLLEGKLICAYETKEDFQRLTQNEDIRERVESTLFNLDRRLQTLESGNAFYAVRNSLDTSAQQDARRFFSDLISKAREELAWMDLLAESTQQETFVQAGNLISYSDVIHAIDYNQSLQQKLRELLKVNNEASIVLLVSKLFERLKQRGIVIEESARNNQYRFTSRLELIQQALVFVAMHNMLHTEPNENHDSAKSQQRML